MTKQPDVYKRRERRVHGHEISLDLQEATVTAPPVGCSLEEIQRWLTDFVDGQLRLVEDRTQKIVGKHDVVRVDYSLMAADVEDVQWNEYTPACVLINAYRLETDREYERRIKAYERRQQRKQETAQHEEATARAQYQKLKARFEPAQEDDG